jgi:hypothetical protein
MILIIAMLLLSVKGVEDMGYLYALAIDETDLTLRDKIDWHLRANVFPPRPEMLDACVAAVEAEDYNTEIELPEGVSYKGTATTAPAWAIIDGFRLEAFVGGEDVEA